jgi:hypothetical protein
LDHATSIKISYKTIINKKSPVDYNRTLKEYLLLIIAPQKRC